MAKPPQTAGSNHHSFASKLILLLTLLPITLAAFAFVLQWRGGAVVDVDDISRWSPHHNSLKFPGMDSSPLATVVEHHSASDCLSLGQSSSPSFPYFHDWKFQYDSDLKPKMLKFDSRGE
ncbi:putative glycosyltransferase-like KOBITO 1 [Helianthus annuus]|nr:putative glycosyltransferase-like KOBITO 1 [Helianthus annuus]